MYTIEMTMMTPKLNTQIRTTVTISVKLEGQGVGPDDETCRRMSEHTRRVALDRSCEA
jgi:hypothetical protein